MQSFTGAGHCCGRYYITRHSLHSLNDVGLIRFRGAHKGCALVCKTCASDTLETSPWWLKLVSACADDVYMEVKKKAKDAILAAIEVERDGEQIDRSLLKNVLGIFIEARAARLAWPPVTTLSAMPWSNACGQPSGCSMLLYYYHVIH